jgi:hypothetical protein
MLLSHVTTCTAYCTGALSTGSCDAVDAPCAYLTVLRDPVERFISHYSYLCLEGWGCTS